MASVDLILNVLLGAAKLLSEGEASATISNPYHKLTRAIREAVPSGGEILANDEPSSVFEHYSQHPHIWHSSLRNELFAFGERKQILKATKILLLRLPGVPTILPPLPKPKPRPKQKTVNEVEALAGESDV